VIFPVDLEQKMNKAAHLLRSKRSVVAFTGAGVSVPSGIPDFRSASTGLWNRFDPMEVASLSAFRDRPDAFFNWLEPLANLSIHAQPNPAHIALADLQTRGCIKTIITQNIDGLHQKAGATDVIELHGNLDTLLCLTCHKTYLLEDFTESWLKEHIYPICPVCRALLKPDITLYEEMLPVDPWDQAEVACLQADLILVAGTSLEVMPASSLPLDGFHRGAKLVIMNLSPTPLDSLAEVVLPLDVASGLPELAKRVMD
jgi:NAD-dependent deacetylase